MTYCTFLGYGARATANSLTNATAIGRFAEVGTSDTCVIGGTGSFAQRVGVGIASPNAKAILDLTSTTMGFLPPRMTTTQRDAIGSPPEGLMVMNITTHKLNFYNGSAWEAVTSS